MKHTPQLPTPRSIRRACGRELYRTLKRLDVFVPKERIAAAEKLYFEKVVGNLLWVYEHRSDRKKQGEWWAEAVAPELAELWEVPQDALVRAFMDGYIGA